ncbi:hypothetical protein [Qipengyuania qiaonensis]|uniref:Uncharacterized protein n=1 Tax=Qipengyuania qiaonensis TaxID=2867240 RepID=A0ABS7J3Y5_9SPHN|nr:hypothetical protein [Qipengyuania qiaonensis]MBX7482048.1 hypothetical protein [Qipengyuania qiaonensis]
MRLNSLAFAGKSLLAPALLLPLAACGEAAAPVEEETPAAEAAAATPAPVASEAISEAVTEPVSEPRSDAPVAASSPQTVTTSAPAPSARKVAPAAVATPTPTATATPAADPHAGHDMSTMSDEDMKAMGHN